MVQEKMEMVSSKQDEKTQESKREKGGLRTMPFIIVNETFEKVASFGLLANMILYLKFDYNMTNAGGARVLFIWSATSNFLPLVGSFVSDSYMGRYRVIALGSIISLLGMISLWSTTVIPGAKPRDCPTHVNCEYPKSSQLALLYASFALMSVGAGGIRPCSLAFGADQLHHPDKQKKTIILQSFFNWYYASVGLSLMVAATVIVYVQDTAGWNWGFGIPAILMMMSTALFYLGSPLYVKMKADKSLFTGFGQVVAAAIKNKRLPPPPSAEWYHYKKGSNLMVPTGALSFLNKACLLKNPGKDVKPDGSATEPWSLCTVQQVEDLKSLIKVMPIWSTGIILAVLLSQHSFQILQANTMDRHLGPSFQIPAGSFVVFGILTLTLWVAIYDRVLVPKLAKLTGNPRGLSLKHRMGIGLVLSSAATAVAAVVESRRRKRAIEQGFSNNGYAVVDMSAMWLVPQHAILGLAEAFNIIGQIEFYYSELPKRMSSIGVALFALGMGVGNLLATVILGIVDDMSKAGGKQISWVSNNINKGHYDKYYWVLTLLGGLNLFYFFICSWAYGPCKENEFGVLGTEDEMDDDEMTKSGHASTLL